MRIENKDRFFYTLIGLLVLMTCGGLFCSIAGGDASVYSAIAKEMAVSSNWLNLTSDGAPWLDKPHFPFWITALSYKLFGFHPFAYILPGLLFHFLGACYTYRLAKKLYSHEAGLLATVIYLSSFFLMYSAITVEAEAYLLGEIIPACYYWYCYHEAGARIRFSLLLKGAFFTALAMMTKGIFVLVPIFSGIVIVMLIQLFKGSVSFSFRWIIKWCLALLLSFVLIAPELIALYTQFDLHPELLVFGKTHVSGIKFYFWDSQFGRFFNTGPITKEAGNQVDIAHYFYYVLVLLWAFLPWSILFLTSVVDFKKSLKHRIPALYLASSFIPTFLMFSITKFQFDHYLNILLPFAGIFLAQYLIELKNKNTLKIFRMQNALVLLLSVLTVILSLKIVTAWQAIRLVAVIDHLVGYAVLYVFLALLALFLAVAALFALKKTTYQNTIATSVLAIVLAVIFVFSLNELVYRAYNNGYLINRYLAMQPSYLVVDHLRSSQLKFFTPADKYLAVDIEKKPAPLISDTVYYLVIPKNAAYPLGAQLLTTIKTLYPSHFSETLSAVTNPVYVKENTNVVSIYLVKKTGESNE